MLASKENARKALKRFNENRGANDPAFVRDFLESVVKRLPSEAAYKRDRERRRGKATT
jgi:hypothetical protein